MLKQSEERFDVLYARLSHEDEKEGISGSIENQKAILEKYAKDNGFDNPKFFFDDGYSGVTFNRPAFMQIMELAEQGKIRTLIVKDHSRLGRNRLVVGQLLEEDFDRLGVRYIAIMDNIDTANGISDLVPMQDLFNEWHAKNTSQKVRNVARSKGLSGQPLTTRLPYGYIKDDEGKWIIDDYAASIVKRIFDLCVDGYGTSQIANILKDEKVLTPSQYYQKLHNKPFAVSAEPYGWCAHTVSEILSRQEYIGRTVNFKVTTKSFKSKKRIRLPKEKWAIFENTHPAIIDNETFDIVQRIRDKRRRPTKSGRTSLFNGLLYCADCGSRMTFNATVKNGYPNFICANYRKDTSNCTSHYIRDDSLYDIVLESVQRVLWYVQAYDKGFAQMLIEKENIEQKKELQKKQKALNKAISRVSELDLMIQRLYEDNVLGKITDERFTALSKSFELEQKQLKTDIPIMQEELNTQIDKSQGLQKFISKAKRLTHLTELTPEILHEFVEKIVVSAPTKVNGKRHQNIDIYYSGVGLIKEPTPEQMEQYFEKTILKEQKQKTA